MKIGCAALYPITRYGFPYSLDNYLKAIAEIRAAGFDACELEINVDVDLDEYIRRIDEVRATLDKNHMTLSAVIGVVQQAFSTDRAAADETLGRFERLCQFIEKVGGDTACICAYMPKEIEGVPGTELYRGSPPLQVRVPRGFDWNLFWDSAVARFGRMARLAANHALVIPKLKRRLMYVHLADNDGTSSQHLPAGRGTLDFPKIFRSLEQIGYTGYANVDFGGVPADQIWDEVRRGRDYFERCLAEAEAVPK